MAKSTLYPEKIKILGNKVYIRDLESVTEEIDENGNTIYNYQENIYLKDEYIKLLKNENDILKNDLELTQEALDFILMNGGV